MNTTKGTEAQAGLAEQEAQAGHGGADGEREERDSGGTGQVRAGQYAQPAVQHGRGHQPAEGGEGNHSGQRSGPAQPGESGWLSAVVRPGWPVPSQRQGEQDAGDHRGEGEGQEPGREACASRVVRIGAHHIRDGYGRSVAELSRGLGQQLRDGRAGRGGGVQCHSVRPDDE
jgi:hypothetical protein